MPSTSWTGLIEVVVIRENASGLKCNLYGFNQNIFLGLNRALHSNILVPSINNITISLL